jgi:hypothetical protein
VLHGKRCIVGIAQPGPVIAEQTTEIEACVTLLASLEPLPDEPTNNRHH